MKRRCISDGSTQDRELVRRDEAQEVKQLEGV
jgi:hypothetical protein